MNLTSDAVAIVKYKYDIKKTLLSGLNQIGGFGEIESPVLIKPNICTMRDGTGHSVTDIDVVKSLISLLLDEDDKTTIKIIESDSQSKNADDAFIKFGYRDYCDEMKNAGFDIATVNLSQETLEKISFDVCCSSKDPLSSLHHWGSEESLWNSPSQGYVILPFKNS